MMVRGTMTKALIGAAAFAVVTAAGAAGAQVTVQAPADQQAAQQADADRRAAESADRQVEADVERARVQADQDADLDQLFEAVRELNRDVDNEERREQRRREIVEENRVAEEEWRRTENERMNHCVNNIDAEKRAMIDQIRHQYDGLIRQMRGNDTPAEVVAQFQASRDTAINAIVDGECEPLHETLRRQRNEDGVERVLEGTITPPPFVIRPAGTPRGN